MDKIVNIRQRIEDKKQRERREQHREKMETIQKVVQCTACHFRCAMCGIHLTAADTPEQPPSSPDGLMFCENCGQEFEDFLAVAKGEKRPDVFYHNKEWLTMWSAWLDYRESISDFVESAEFKRILEEIDRGW
jgi:transcription elongation factor Elf1